MTSAEAVTCPVCGSDQREELLHLRDLPVLINAQVSPEHARDVPRGDMRLVVCHACAHLYNAAFDSALADYDAAYENTLHYSAQFREFATALVDDLVHRHALEGATVGELGSGPGHLLSMLCEAGAASGLGWDPSYDPERLGAPDHPAVTISTDPFPEDGSVPVRLALSQHVLEHLDDPVAALVAQRRAVAGSDGRVYTEVPNGQLMVEHTAIWDLIYEHRSYFVPTSLYLACRRAGLAVTETGIAFGGQFLWCEAEPSTGSDDDGPDAVAVAAAVDAARAFGLEANRLIEQAREELAAYTEAGPVALWGAGSKGATYLNLVADGDEVAAVVDINPRKAGWGVPGTSATIGAPKALVDVRPRTVLAANPMYIGEIADELAELGLDAEVHPIWT